MERSFKYSVDKAEAIELVNHFLQALLSEELPEHASLSSLRQPWFGDKVYFSYERKVGGIPATPLSGIIEVNDSEVNLKLGIFSPVGSDSTASFFKFRLMIANKLGEFLTGNKTVKV